MTQAKTDHLNTNPISEECGLIPSQTQDIIEEIIALFFLWNIYQAQLNPQTRKQK